MSENVVQNETSKVQANEVERNPAVPGEVFDRFMTSGETVNMTIKEAAAHLGMKETSFTQRLNGFRKNLKTLEAKAEQLGFDEHQKQQIKSMYPKFKSAGRGRGPSGEKQEFNKGQRALIELLKSAG